MRLLLDTHVLIWSAGAPGHVPAKALSLMTDARNELFFSPVNIWEVAIKRALGKTGFQTDPRLLRNALEQNGYREIALTSAHGEAVADLPPIHKDPFDRILIAQAMVEGITLLTSDAIMARYPGPVQRV